MIYFPIVKILVDVEGGRNPEFCLKSVLTNMRQNDNYFLPCHEIKYDDAHHAWAKYKKIIL